jgi:hypothetical protein
MKCEYCNRIIGHDYRCPNYIPPKANVYCCFCEDGIYDGDDYCVNIDHEYAHYDCLHDLDTKELLQWVGCEIETMGGYYADDD